MAEEKSSRLFTVFFDLIKIALGGIVGYLLFINTTGSPNLVFKRSATQVERIEGKEVASFNVVVMNDGSKEVENIECCFILNGNKCKDGSISPPHLHMVPKFENGMVFFNTSLLNPSESFMLTLYIEVPVKGMKPIAVSVRGKGVTGYEDNSERTVWNNFLLFNLFFAPIAGLYLGARLTYLKMKKEPLKWWEYLF